YIPCCTCWFPCEAMYILLGTTCRDSGSVRSRSRQPSPLLPVPAQRLGQPLLERHSRLVTQVLAGAGDVRPRMADVAGARGGVSGGDARPQQAVEGVNELQQVDAAAGADVVDLSGDAGGGGRPG